MWWKATRGNENVPQNVNILWNQPQNLRYLCFRCSLFAVHAFCGDIIFLCSYHTVGCANFVFFTFLQYFFVHFAIFFYFNARHLLKNIFHYASPCCVYSLARHLLRRMFQYTSRSWISNSVHVVCCVRSLVMCHGWFHSVRFHPWISFISLFGWKRSR